MELREYLTTQLADAHRLIDAALTDMTPELAHWEPGGTANTIAALLAHMTVAEDNAVNRVLKAGQPLLEAEGWSVKTGIPTGRGAVWQKGWTLDLDAFTAYSRAVRDSAEAYMATLDPADLDREVEWYSGPRPAGSLLRVVVLNHIIGHAGEISALKGINGLVGIPI